MFQVIQNIPSSQEKDLVAEESLTHTLQATFSLHRRVFLLAPLACLFLGLSTFPRIPSTLTAESISFALWQSPYKLPQDNQSRPPGSERQHLLWPWAKEGEDLVFHRTYVGVFEDSSLLRGKLGFYPFSEP